METFSSSSLAVEALAVELAFLNLLTFISLFSGRGCAAVSLLGWCKTEGSVSFSACFLFPATCRGVSVGTSQPELQLCAYKLYAHEGTVH